jgi:energy-coupling factor transport system permease protein
MRSPLAYSPGSGPLSEASALAASVYLGSFAVVAFVFSNPIVLGGAGVAVAVAGIAGGASRALRLALRWGLATATLFVVVNAIASQRGDTILIRGGEIPVLGQIDVSAEAVVEGAVLGLRVLVVMVAFAVHSAVVDPDRILRLLRPLARRSALTATLLTRLVPVAAADHARLREAAALRGPGAAEVGRAALVRRLVAGSLDRAVDVAATLELRGYGLGAPNAVERGRRSRRGFPFLLTGLVIVVGPLAARFAGVGGFDPYPLVSVEADAATLALAAALPLLAAVPFALIRIARWRAVGRVRSGSGIAARGRGG